MPQICMLQHLFDFNPRPRKEGDMPQICMLQHLFDFNPRPRKEGDGYVRPRPRRDVDISIHALVKRATTACRPYKRSYQNFNPRPRKEGDP